MRLRDYKTMKPLLLLLERLWGPLGASLRALGASLRALGDVLGLGEPLFSKTSVLPRREHDFRNLYEQEREASYRGSVCFRVVEERAGREAEKTRR